MTTADAIVGLVVAMDERGLIGRAGGLPWRLPDDLKHFKALTLGKTVLMGRKTWDSLGRPLPQRENWVLTRDPAFRADGCRTFASADAALRAHRERGGELMVIGGGEVYRQLLPAARRIHLTEVHGRFDGDAWFPALERRQWRETARHEHPADERHACAFSFVTLER
ncbi:MAG: dihydrofolate reductase [Gammaproteobacteria bacterium]|nr:dihydrofolate reductase [Gammaproteobacteria bacterium]